MKKKYYKEKINNIKNKNDFESLKTELKRYKSIYDKIKNISCSAGYAIVTQQNHTSFGSNIKVTKQNLNSILDSYSWKDAIFDNYHIFLNTKFYKNLSKYWWQFLVSVATIIAGILINKFVKL